jgi:Lar family restriction alleviation protein
MTRNCPFCGKKAAVDTLKYTGGRPAMYRVQCLECRAATKWYDTEEAAWEAWNKRVTGGPPAQAKINFAKMNFEEIFLEAYDACWKFIIRA